jgi:predicted metal-dependent hydrolase
VVSSFWFGQSRAKTIAFDAMHVMLFYGERYMTRTVADCGKRSARPDVRRICQAFVTQEMTHAGAHKAFWPNIGADLSPLQRFFRWLGDDALMRLPRLLRLALTLAIEHNTATFAEVVLTRDSLAAADPQPRALLEWHCAEEIEHKRAVFTVLDDAIDARVGRYLLRLVGMFLAVFVLGAAHAVAMAMLWRQAEAREPRGLRGVCRDLADLVGLFFTEEALLVHGLARGLGYLRPSFRPTIAPPMQALAERTLGRPLAFPA